MKVSLQRRMVRVSLVLATAAAAWGTHLPALATADDQFAEPWTVSLGDVSPEEYEYFSRLLRLPDQPWSRIHWHSSLTAARLEAQKLGKPLLIRASYGTPHGVC